MLREASRRLKKTIRREDAVGRYGGEEFVMMLTNTNLHAAKHTAERLRLALAEEPCILEPGEDTPDGNVIAITANIGVAVYGEHGTTREALIENEHMRQNCPPDVQQPQETGARQSQPERLK